MVRPMLRIALFICPQTVCSSLSMAMDAFQLANQLAGERLFHLQRFSLDGRAVQLQFASISVDGDLSLAESADLVMLPATGSAIDTTLAMNALLLPWLATQAQHRHLASLCSSAFYWAPPACWMAEPQPHTGAWHRSFASAFHS